MNHGPGFDAEPIRTSERLVDDRQTLAYLLTFRDNSSFSISLNHGYSYLLDDFDPTRTDGPELAAGFDYQ